jgi:ribosomal protein L4
VLDGAAFDEPSTAQAADILAGWEKQVPVVVVAGEDEDAVVKSFRNLARVAVTVPAELEVADVVWARSLLITEVALPLVQQRAGGGQPE